MNIRANMPNEGNETGNARLAIAADKSDCADQFAYEIQVDAERTFKENDNPRQQGLLTDLYNWEQSTIENRERFKHSGWFHIAKEYYKQHRLSQSKVCNTATT